MILFLTLAYCAVLWVLVKVKLLRPTLLVKLSPVLWVLLLFVGLFIPLQFWAPQGNVIISQLITRMTPSVGGQVVTAIRTSRRLGWWRPACASPPPPWPTPWPQRACRSAV